MNKIVISVIIVVVLLVAGFFGWQWWAASQNTKTPTPSTQETQNENPEPVVTEGMLYVSVTDAAVNMKNVTAVDMTVDKVQVFSQANGWITLSETPQTFQLLDLKSKSQAMLLAKLSVPADTYSQIKLTVAKISVTESGKTQEAKLPSGELKIMANTKVNTNTNSVVKIDVLADKSLHKTGNGKFIFAPVIKVDSTTNADVVIDDKNVVTVLKGSADMTINIGMDIDGSVKNDFVIDPNTNLDIDANGGVIKAVTGAKVILP